MSRVSVALCTYNGANYLSAQLESLAAQTRLPDELVATDDCSSDTTVTILKGFAARAPFPVRLHVNENNLGLVKNFEQTILRCQGEVIALCDQDDVWLPAKLAKLTTVLDEKPRVGLVFSDAELIDEQSNPLGRRLWDITFPPPVRKRFERGQEERVLATANVVTGATMAFRTIFRTLFCPIPELSITVHDGWIAQIIALFADLDIIDDPLMLYRQHPRQEKGVGLSVTKSHPTGVFSAKSNAFDRVALDYALQIARLGETVEALDRLEKLLNQSVSENFHCQKSSPQDGIGALRKLEALLKDLRAHYVVRGRLHRRRIQRVVPVTRELLSRRYHLYSRGILSVFNDLVR